VARGHIFRTNTDTEIIVHLYEDHGEDCVKLLRGMFTFAIWDRNRKQLFIARDHFGIKPLYYHISNGKFLYGSEIKSILATGEVRRSIRPESFLNYLTFQYVPDPDTMFDGISKLPPATTITVRPDGSCRLNKYWDPMFEPVKRTLTEDIEELRERLRDSVTHHMVSDVERGCFLSSGIDSTAIAAHMRAIEPIRTFSVGFEGNNNETIIARETAAALGTEHYSKVITEKEFFDAIPSAVWHQDEPVADPAAIALYHVAELASEHVTVVLSGEGADELFGGYRIYREPQALRAMEWMPLPMKRSLHRLFAMLPGGMKGRNYLLRGTTPLEERFLGNAKIYTEDMKGEILSMNHELLRSYRNPVQIAGDYYKKTAHLDPVSRMQYIDMNLWMPGDILMKADKMTMAHSLELRVPFLDTELFELARRIQVGHRIAGGTTKYVFRKAMEGIIPDFILNRPKLGFPVPLRDWLKGPSAGRMLEEIKGSGIDTLVHMGEVEKLFKLHRDGVQDSARRLWVLYMFALWHATYIQEQPKASFAAV
jgi:asparagine synthase (glutamine-hydrolysing)